VSCPAAQSCVAVGFISRHGAFATLAERWDGLQWRQQRTPDPRGAANSYLLSVSCPGTTTCTAVGLSATRSGVRRALAEQWDGTSWRLQTTPNPRHQANIQLRSVSCPSAKACTAVGIFASGSFAEQWNGKSWRILTVPLPRGGRNGFLNAVSCSAANACTATGSFSFNPPSIPLAERWNGRRWTPQHVSSPAGVLASELLGVSCPRRAACFAVGDAVTGATTGYALADHWNGSRWSAQLVPLASGTMDAVLESLSCSGPTTCSAVGNFINMSSIQSNLAERYS
jgi:hypothetical protein